METCLCPNIKTDILLTTDAEIETYIDVLINAGYSFHHKSIRAGYVRKNNRFFPVAGFVREYDGKFGVGVIVCTYRSYSKVNCSYYLKAVNCKNEKTTVI